MTKQIRAALLGTVNHIALTASLQASAVVASLKAHEANQADRPSEGPAGAAAPREAKQ